MFEKYKDMKEKRNHFGMSKREYYKLMFLVLIAVGCLVVLALNWASPPPPEEVEGTGGKIEIPKDIKRVGEPGARERIEQYKDRLLKQRAETAGDSEKVELPEIPKPPTPWEPDSEIWKQVDDGAVDVLEEQVLFYALHQLNSMTQEEIRKKVQQDGNVSPTEVMAHPQDYRGKFVSVTGTLLYMDDQVLNPNRSGLQQYWYGLVYNQRHKPYRRFYFYMFEKDQEWLTQQEARNRDLTRNGDLVTLSGIFVKLYRNRTEGGAIMTYPFIVARKLEPARPITFRGQWQYSIGMLIGIAVILGGVFAFFFIASRRDQKKDEAFLHSRRYRKAGLVSNEKLRKIATKAKGKEAPAEGTEQPGGAPGEPEAPAPSDKPGDSP